MAKDRKIPIMVHLPPELVAALKDEQFGDSFSKVIADRLAQAIGMGPREAAPASPLDAIELRKKEAEAAMAEQRAAILRREYVKRDMALDVVARDFANIKSRVARIPLQISGLTPEQNDDGNRAVQDCFTDLSGEKSATWDDLAQKAADDL